jgi:predicted nucleotidyltransferase
MSRLLKLNPNFKPAFDGIHYAEVLVQKIRDQLELKEAYLFGSAAEKKNTANSDLDILIVVNSEADIKSCYRIVNTPFFSEIAVDWIVKTKVDFDTLKEIGGVCRVSFLTGKKICG